MRYHLLTLLLSIASIFARSIQSPNQFKGDDAHNEVAVDLKVELLTDERYETEGDEIRAARLINSWIQRNMVNGHLIIPYIIDTNIPSSAQSVIKNAIKHVNERLLCHEKPIVLRNSSNSNLHYLRFIYGIGCWSYVGMSFQYKGYQNISIGQGCETIGIVSHELLHALGFHHEQNRPDRDNYVEINRENIKNGSNTNFQKRTLVHSVSRKSPYDYQSIMHYGTHYFSKNGLPTITVKQKGAQIGQRSGLSGTDIAELNAYFQCGEIPSIELMMTTFSQKYHDKGVYYHNWISQGCVDQSSICPQYKKYCASVSKVRDACLYTCSCSLGRPNVKLPSGLNSNFDFIPKVNILGRIMRGTLANKMVCSTCNSGTSCPTHKFCTRAIYKRLPGKLTSGRRSDIAFAAYNFKDTYHLINTLIGPYQIGSGNESRLSYYQAYKEFNLQCQNMDLFIFGYKGYDDIHVFKFEVFYGPCSNAPPATLDIEATIKFAAVSEDGSLNFTDQQNQDWSRRQFSGITNMTP